MSDTLEERSREAASTWLKHTWTEFDSVHSTLGPAFAAHARAEVRRALEEAADSLEYAGSADPVEWLRARAARYGEEARDANA